MRKNFLQISAASSVADLSKIRTHSYGIGWCECELTEI
jgi:hypothetical protein